MKKKITSVPFTKVAKMKFPALVNNVVRIVEKYDPATLHIDLMYNELVAVQPLVKTLLNVYKRHPKTESLKELRLKRRKLFMAILSQKKAIEKSNLTSQEAARVLVLPFIDEHFSNIVANDMGTQAERVSQMSDALKGNAPMAAAMADLGLKIYIDELLVLEQKIIAAEELRLQEMSKKPKMNTLIVKRQVSDALMNLLNRIQLAQIEYKELDYEPLMNELNQYLTPVGAAMKSKTTRNKNAVEAALSTAEATTTSTQAV